MVDQVSLQAAGFGPGQAGMLACSVPLTTPIH